MSEVCTLEADDEAHPPHAGSALKLVRAGSSFSQLATDGAGPPVSVIGGIPTDNQNDRDLEEVRSLARDAARVASSKGAEDTLILEVGKVLAITDAFVITSGRNHRQVKTIAEEVEGQLKAAGGPAPIRVEGAREAEWVLLDYGAFVVHVFLDSVRAYYELERLWSDAPRLEWEETRAG